MLQKRTHHGFTLIEMMVSIALFAVVITVALPTMLVVTKASGRSQAVQTTIDNASFAIDSMSRRVRLGRNYRCQNDSIDATLWAQTTNNPYAATQDCASGGSVFIFTDQYGVRQAYQYNTSSASLDGWSNDAKAWVQLTSPQVRITNAAFVLKNSLTYDGASPIANFTAQGVSVNEPTAPSFSLGTSMTQYVVERGFAIRRLGQGTAGSVLFSAGAQFGDAVANVGDVNGDGTNDLLVGIRGYGNSAGGAYFLRMNKNGTVNAATRLVSGENNMPTFTAGTQVGQSVAFGGDFDSDGLTEVVLGAHAYDGSRGELYVVTLKGDGTAGSSTPIRSGQNGMPTIPSASSFGFSVAHLDARTFVVGAPGDSSACVACGALYLITFNADRDVVSSVKISSGISLSAYDTLGSSVASLGYDRDGYRIIAAGTMAARCDASSINICGGFYIFHIKSDGSVARYTKYTSGTANMPTLTHLTQFGASVAPAGDLDGDGVSDILVGTADSNIYRPGSLYLVFLNSDDSIKGYRHMSSGVNGGPTLDNFDVFGNSVASIGDLNGDRRADFAVGAPNDDGDGSLSNAGALYILFGK